MCCPTGSWFWYSWSRTGYPYSRLFKNGLLKFLEQGIKNWPISRILNANGVQIWRPNTHPKHTRVHVSPPGPFTSEGNPLQFIQGHFHLLDFSIEVSRVINLQLFACRRKLTIFARSYNRLSTVLQLSTPVSTLYRFIFSTIEQGKIEELSTVY